MEVHLNMVVSEICSTKCGFKLELHLVEAVGRSQTGHTRIGQGEDRREVDRRVDRRDLGHNCI